MGGWRQIQLAIYQNLSLLPSEGPCTLEGLNKYQRLNECWQDIIIVQVTYHEFSVSYIQGTMLGALCKHFP